MQKKNFILYLTLVAIFATAIFAAPQKPQNAYASSATSTYSFQYYDQIRDKNSAGIPQEHRQGVLDTYNTILQAYQQGNLKKNTTLHFPIGWGTDETISHLILYTAEYALKYDYPELSLYNFDYESILFEYKITISYEIDMTDAQISLIIKNAREKRDSIVTLANQKETLYEKVYFVNEWLVKNADYNDKVENNESNIINAPLCHTFYAALFGNDIYEPVCDGYSYTFKYILDALNIPSIIVCGIATQTNGCGLHAWNQVYLYGNHYGIDVTWNDPYDDKDPRASIANVEYNMTNHFLKGFTDFYAPYENGKQLLSIGKRTILNFFIKDFEETETSVTYLPLSYKLSLPSIRTRNYEDPLDTVDRITFKFYLNSNNGSYGSTTMFARLGENMPLLNSAPYRNGYIFKGYWDSPIGGKQYYNEYLIGTSVWDKKIYATLYAQWEKIPEPVPEPEPEPEPEIPEEDFPILTPNINHSTFTPFDYVLTFGGIYTIAITILTLFARKIVKKFM